MRKLTLKFLACFIFLPLLVPVCARGQAGPSAYVSQHGIYVGGEYALFNSDYFGGNQSLNASAFAIYGDYYVTSGAWPITLDVNYTKVPNHYGNENRYLSSLILGPTIRHRFGRWQPFAKVGVGIGHLTANGIVNYHQLGQHFALGYGGGLDYRLTDHIMLRPIDFTFERWNFSPSALSPQILGFGLSYRIH